jgi:conjugative relaxase-like TrwC/TraI family protein
MLTIRAMSNGAGYASRHLSANDYYSQDEGVVGQWFGKGAEKLGLTGEVKLEDFEAVRQQLDPTTGEKLRQRQSADRVNEDGTLQSQGRNLYDCTVSAPKSVSVMAIVGGDERLIEAHRKAVAEMLHETEAVAATRVRLNGANEDRTTGNVVMACYEHDASRELDPQLHTHCVAANVTFDPVEDRWKALQARPFYEQRRMLTEVYRNALAREVQALGYTIESRHDAKGRDLGFEIAGLSTKLLKKYSRRSAQRDAAIAEFTETNGREPTDNEVTVLVRNTREPKLKEISTAEVREQQQTRLTAQDRKELQTAREHADKNNCRAQHSNPFHSLNYALEHVFERVSVATEHELLETALQHGRGTMTMDDLRTALKVTEVSGNLLRAGSEIATQASLERERDMIHLVNEDLGAHERLGGNRQHDPSRKLTAEQNQAVQFVLDSRDFAVSVQGAAGTGKTAMLTELQRELAHGERLVTAVAPTQGAVEELQKVGFVEAMTIEGLLENSEAQSWLKGRALVIDEAGMVSGRQMHELLKLAKKQDARIILSGDTSQLQSVEACDALRVIEKESLIKTVSLNEVKRQQVKAYREAVEALREDPAVGFEKLTQMDAVKITPFEQRPEAVARAYSAAHGEALVVCPSHDEIERVTHAIREQQRAEGLLEKGSLVDSLKPLNWTQAQKREPKNFEPGLVLVFHKGTKDAQRHQAFEVVDVQDGRIIAKDDQGREVAFNGKQAKAFTVSEKREIEVATGDKLLLQQNRRGDLHVTNGERVSVQYVDSDGFIHLEDGRILPKDYKQFHYGYAITAHRAQGKSVDHVIVSGDAMSKELFYVAASRGRKSIEVYTSDVELLQESIGRSAARQSATELHARMVAWQVSQQQQQNRESTTAYQQQAARGHAAPSVDAQAAQNAQGAQQSQGASHER